MVSADDRNMAQDKLTLQHAGDVNPVEAAPLLALDAARALRVGVVDAAVGGDLTHRHAHVAL